MILENGTVRTLEPTLPTTRALAIAGDRIAGGVGTHETALASPERVDLGGRCVLPGLNPAALAHANGDLEVDGGVVVRDEHGEPTGVLREECAWHFRDLHVRPTEDEMVEAARDGVRIATARGVTAVHDKDGWLGALGV